MTNARWVVPLISLALLALVGLWRHESADATRVVEFDELNGTAPAAEPDEGYALFVG